MLRGFQSEKEKEQTRDRESDVLRSMILYCETTFTHSQRVLRANVNRIESHAPGACFTCVFSSCQ